MQFRHWISKTKNERQNLEEKIGDAGKPVPVKKRGFISTLREEAYSMLALSLIPCCDRA